MVRRANEPRHDHTPALPHALDHNFCAPVFVFLAGTSTYLHGAKDENKKSLSSFLLKRGLWLVFAEPVIVNFAWTFDITYSNILLQVIWALGTCMTVLAALVYLPSKLILTIGLTLPRRRAAGTERAPPVQPSDGDPLRAEYWNWRVTAMEDRTSGEAGTH